MSCGIHIAQLVDHFEGGGSPLPIFFSGTDCTGHKWPPDFSFIDRTYAKVYTRADVCSSTRVADCPVPYIQSMIVSPNLRIEFVANDLSPGETVPSRLPARIQEFGQLNLYGDKIDKNIIADTGKTKEDALIWNSAACPNKGEDVCEPGVIDGKCLFPLVGVENFTDDGKLLKSMVSCNSPFYPSFIGVNVARISPNERFTNRWPSCRVSDINGHLDTSGILERESVCDYTITNGRLSIETAAYVALRNNRPAARDFFSNVPRGMTTCPGNLSVVPGTFAQACSCIANAQETMSSSNLDFKERFCPALLPCTGDCRPGVAGGCIKTNNFVLRTLQSSCTCGGDVPKIEGSIKNFKLTLVDGSREVDFDTLQSIWCTRGLTVAGVPIQRYTQGSEVCDSVMRKTCLDTGRLVDEPDFLDTCECILEEKKLQSQFAGLDLPSHCFTSTCSTSRGRAYRTKPQATGCSAKLCSQTLSIHGNQILMQGFQEVVCNGTVFNLEKVGPVQPLAVEETPQIQTSEVRFGLFFFVIVGIMALLVFLALLWGARSLVLRKRQKTRGG